jgi:hypothetical protein
MSTALNLRLAALLVFVAVGACNQQRTGAGQNNPPAFQPPAQGESQNTPSPNGVIPPPSPTMGSGAPPRGRGIVGIDEATFTERFRTRIMRADASGDGRVTLPEFLSWKSAHPTPGGNPSRYFKSLDMNGDGVITADELAARAPQMYARRARMGGAGAGGRGNAGVGGGRGLQ